MPNLFHDLRKRAVPGWAIVTIGSLNEWLSAVAGRTVQVIGADSAREAEGAHFGGAGGTQQAATRRWTVEPVELGYTIGYGTASSRVPRIGGVPIDEQTRTPETVRPWIEYRADGIIDVEASLRFTTPLIPALGAAGEEPPYQCDWEWLAWPELKWRDRVEDTRSPPPPSGTSNDSIVRMPIACVIAGVIHRLRWSDINFTRPYVDTIGETQGNL